MESGPLLSRIAPSDSDKIIHSHGFDLVQEYAEIALQLPDRTVPAVELATGTGRMIAVLSTFIPSVITGDISLNDLPRARKRVPPEFLDRVTFLQLDLEQLPFRSESLLSVICMNTLHETEHPRLCLKEMIRTIHCNGTFIVGEFNRRGFDLMQTVQQHVYHTDHSEGSISSAEIKEILSESFSTVSVLETALNTTYIAANKRCHQK